MYKRLLVAGCVAFMLTAIVQGNQDQDKKKKKKTSVNVKRLYGDWEFATGARGGEEVTKERLMGTVSITKDTFTLPAGPDEKFVMTYKIDASKTPAQIDLKIKSGPVPEGNAVGIIKLQKGQVVLCYDPTGEKRPEDFKSTKDNGAFMFTLKRKPKEGEQKKKKKKKKKKKDVGN